MIVIPAIDIRGGRCVRLLRGDFSQETIYSDDPVEVAVRWQSEGAQMLHVVDLDGAREGWPVNLDTVAAICRSVDIPVEVGGGMRSLDDIRSVLDAGASRAVLGTLALEDPDLLARTLGAWGPGIAVSLDARDGLLTTRGWLGSSDVSATSAAAGLASSGVKCLIYTDISRDGTLAGPNLAGTRAVLEAAGPGVEVIASGGVGSADDLLRLEVVGVAGAIVGKALYTGDVDLRAYLARTAQARQAGGSANV